MLSLLPACAELYRGLDLLKNYRILNFTAFVKILKKHDKRGCWKTSSPVIMSLVGKAPFFTSPLLSVISKKVEDTYVQAFHHADRGAAMAKLRPQRRHLSQWVPCRLGFELGLSTALLLVLVAVAIFTEDFAQQSYYKATFPVFRATTIAVLHFWGWGAVVYCCTRTRINYVFILEADQKTHLRYSEIFEVASSMTLWLLFCMTAFYATWAFGDDGEPWLEKPYYIHLALNVVLVFALFCPFNVFRRPTRRFFLKTMASIALSPFTKVNFRDFFLGDQLCSLARIMLDLFYAGCFYTTDTCLTNESEPCSSLTTWRLRTSTGRWSRRARASSLSLTSSPPGAVPATVLPLRSRRWLMPSPR